MQFHEWRRPTTETVRIEAKDDQYRIVTHTIGWKTHSSHGQCSSTTKTLSPQEWAEAERLVEESDFWKLPWSEGKRPFVKFPSLWFFEGAEGQRHHAVMRVSPHLKKEQSAYVSAGKHFLSMIRMEN
jgi:hypothetical protein